MFYEAKILCFGSKGVIFIQLCPGFFLFEKVVTLKWALRFTFHVNTLLVSAALVKALTCSVKHNGLSPVY